MSRFSVRAGLLTEWWWDSITIAASLVAFGGLLLGALVVTEFDGWLTLAGLVLGAVLVVAGSWVMLANWREYRTTPGESADLDERDGRRWRIR